MSITLRKRIFKKLAEGSFKERFLNTPTNQLQDLIYKEALNQGRPKDLVPVNITDLDGISITYYVMRDYLSIGGIRVPVSGITAQKLASAWGMKLPSTKMSKEIYARSDLQIPMIAMPLPGMTSAKTSVEFNEKTDQKIKEKSKENAKLSGGHMKDVVAPDRDPSRLGLSGGYKEDKTAWHGSHGVSMHDPSYFDYSSGFRGIDDNVLVNGKPYTLTAIYSDPNLTNLRKYFSYTGSWGQYKTDTAPAAVIKPIQSTPDASLTEMPKAPAQKAEAPIMANKSDLFKDIESLNKDFPDLGFGEALDIDLG